MRTLLLACLLLCGAPSAPAAAQCCGDCAGDGSVTIDDLVTAVRNALDDCSQVTPTVGPSETPTPRPTPTRTPNDRCPRNFTDATNQCTFNGRYNNGCGTAVAAAFAVSGETIVVTINTGISNPAVVRFAATRDTATRADLFGWSVNNFQTTNPVAGELRLQDSGEQLIVFPNDSPFMIQSCSFVQYVGDYVRPRAAALAGEAAPDDARAAPDFERLRAWRARPVPDLAP